MSQRYHPPRAFNALSIRRPTRLNLDELIFEPEGFVSMITRRRTIFLFVVLFPLTLASKAKLMLEYNPVMPSHIHSIVIW